MKATESIPLLSLSEKEQSTILFLRELCWPKDYEVLIVCPLALVKQWLYGLDPKVAIVVSCDPDFKKLFKFKQDQNWFGKFVDNLVRRLRGINF